jgi:long-chain acyl-CoA synthetase
MTTGKQYPGAVAGRDPERPAVIMSSSGQVVTYGQIEERSRRLAQLFRERGLVQGDHVAIMLENDPRFVEIMWAAVRAGLYYTPINWHLTAGEAAYIINDCEAKALITSSTLASVARDLDHQAVPGLTTRLMIGDPIAGFEHYDDAIGARPPEPLADEAEGLGMFYSSGTTGRPKGIKWPLGLEPLGTRADPVLGMLGLLGVGDGDVYLSPAPLYHTAPANFTVSATRIGATVVVMERFDPEDCLRAIERYHVTHGQFVPTMFVRMLKLPEAMRKAYDLSSLRAVIHAAAPCPIEIKRQMIEWWGPIILEYYAASEGAGGTFITSQEWLAHPGSVGRSVVGKAVVLDDDRREVPVGEIGTIWFLGGLPFEYHNDPDKTAEARTSDGLATTGDMGYIDADGYIYLTDRKSYMIISGGVNIYPQEAENVLAVHPKVLDVAVFGVPNPEMGEEVKAVVQPVDWADAGPALEVELISYCKEQLASYKCPRTVDFDKELPRLDNGKLYKRQLRDRYWGGQGSTEAQIKN